MTNRLDKFRFIRLVKAQPSLYDIKLEGYKDYLGKAKLWTTIADNFGISADAAKKIWKGLRDKLRREMIKTESTASSQWEFFDEMQFLNKFPKKSPRRHIMLKAKTEQNNSTNSVISDSVQEMDESQTKSRIEQTEVSSRTEDYMNTLAETSEFIKPKRIKLQSSELEDEDEDVLFTKTIAAMLKKIQPVSRNNVKLQILQAVVEAQNNDILDERIYMRGDHDLA